MRPIIALSLARPVAERALSNQRYREALEAAGAAVLEVYPDDQIPTDVDGVLLAGGGDIDPARYGEANSASADIDDKRDELELSLVRQAIQRGLPVLGICRGFQVLNVAYGGKLIQDVPDHRPSELRPLLLHDDVRPRPGSRLAAAVGDAPLVVNSRHHQAVKEQLLGKGLLSTVEIGGLVEAFEATDARWVVAVQWHPERTDEVSPAAVRVFGAFVDQAGSAPTARMPGAPIPGGQSAR